MGQDARIKVGQQGGSEARGVGRMDKMPGKVRPGIHFHEYLTQLHAGQALRDARS